MTQTTRDNVVFRLVCAGVVVALCTSIACEQQTDPSTQPKQTARSASPPPLADGLFTPSEVRRIQGMTLEDATPPRDETNEVSLDPRAAKLGQYLFYDTRLSGNEHVACSSCHSPHRGFADPSKLGQGIEKTRRHPPTLINVAHQRFFDWDGKSDSLWSQASRPIESPDEHGASRTQVAMLIATDPKIRAAYEEVFDAKLPEVEVAKSWPRKARPVPKNPDDPAHQAWLSLSEEHREQITRIFTDVLKAIAAYEERLVSFDTPFDRYARGLASQDAEALAALSPEAKRGLKTFITDGKCVVCHTGPLFSDMAFHNLGLERREWMPEGIDEGRWDGVPHVKNDEFNALGKWSAKTDGERAEWLGYLRRTREDHGQFKTPGLRGVALTAPYMHGGHFDTLAQVVRFYVLLDEEVEVGHREDMLTAVNLSPERQMELVAFLEALTPPPFPKELTGQPPAP